METAPQAPVKRASQTNPVVIPVTTHRSAESAAQRLRQAMRIHASVIVGTPLDQVLASEMITRRELEEFLSEFYNLRPEITWLRTYVREQEEMARLREEAGANDRFKALQAPLAAAPIPPGFRLPKPINGQDREVRPGAYQDRRCQPVGGPRRSSAQRRPCGCSHSAPPRLARRRFGD